MGRNTPELDRGELVNRSMLLALVRQIPALGGEEYTKGVQDTMKFMEERVKSAPPIDAVHVIRCQCCRRFVAVAEGESARSYCSLHGHPTCADDFCSRALHV